MVEDIAPSISITEGFPEYIAAMKKVTFSPSLKKITQARKSASEQLHDAFPVILLLFQCVKYRTVQCINQSKHIYIAPCVVASESEVYNG